MNRSTEFEKKIADMNLTYLLLAQQLIREDLPTALVRLGMTTEVAEMLEQLSTQQILKISSGPSLVAGLKFTDPEFWNAYLQDGRAQSASRFHASILMASQSLEHTI